MMHDGNIGREDTDVTLKKKVKIFVLSLDANSLPPNVLSGTSVHVLLAFKKNVYRILLESTLV
jgi:hypothetical protein